MENTMSSITVRVSEDMVQELDELARAMDRSRSWVVTDALARYLAEERQWMESVKRGIEAADRGELIPHEQVMEEMRQMIRERLGE
jgi:predicted transcriptional regulator